LIGEPFSVLRVEGRGQMDHSGIATLIEERSNLKVGKA